VHYFPFAQKGQPSRTFHNRIIKLDRQKDFMLFGSIAANIANILGGESWISCSTQYIEKMVRKGIEPDLEAQAKTKEASLCL
jgi:hypothetical protein